jgi:hypothetical protein
MHEQMQIMDNGDSAFETSQVEKALNRLSSSSRLWNEQCILPLKHTCIVLVIVVREPRAVNGVLPTAIVLA